MILNSRFNTAAAREVHSRNLDLNIGRVMHILRVSELERESDSSASRNGLEQRDNEGARRAVPTTVLAQST